ncbi:unnamed protein product [Linum trigynum]|uniref:Uncharacterized protein n=1 Tax=Linum trigynum TaxID=586398 RepID=A0AAV2D0B5_9ROSI
MVRNSRRCPDDLRTLRGDRILGRKTADGRWVTWLVEEDLILKKAVKKYGSRTDEWDRIASLLDGRSGEECKARVCGWFPAMDRLLKAAVEFYGKDQWRYVSRQFIHKTPKQCKARWIFLMKQQQQQQDDAAAAAADDQKLVNANPAAVDDQSVAAADHEEEKLIADPAVEEESSVKQDVAADGHKVVDNPPPAAAAAASDEWNIAGCNLRSRM